MSVRLAATLGLVVMLWPALPVRASSAHELAQSFFAKHCVTCHGHAKPKGDFLIAALKPDFSDEANREQWLKVVEQLRDGTMPPPEEPRPQAQDVATVVEAISKQIAAAESAAIAAHGRTVPRRLNRAEYMNTVRDLLAVDVELKDLLLPDTSITGFDNSAIAQ